MKFLFEEYGKGVLVAIAVIGVLACLFVYLDLFGYMKTVADLKSDISHEQSENALNQVISREKPSADFSGVSFRFYGNQAFRPKLGVVFTDAEGAAVANVEVVSIVYRDADDNTVEFISHYNQSEDVIVLNMAHYVDDHEACTLSEFAEVDGKWLMDDGAEQNYAGFVTVTYRAVDSENQVAVVQRTFVVDAATFK